jgi:hypothetical protein
MTSALVKSRSPYLSRVIRHRTRGLTRGPVTRLMSPSDFGEILKPFVFLDLFDHEGSAFNGTLHPHSGIATLTYVAEGAVTYIDPNGERGTLRAGGVEWMQANPVGRAGSNFGLRCRRNLSLDRQLASSSLPMKSEEKDRRVYS